MIKVKTFRLSENPNTYDSFEHWQTQNPTTKIIDTKVYSEQQTYTEQKIIVTYEEPEQKEVK